MAELTGARGKELETALEGNAGTTADLCPPADRQVRSRSGARAISPAAASATQGVAVGKAAAGETETATATSAS
jgi:hypothetical protein